MSKKLPTETEQSESLTDNQERFCQEYLKDLNATQAAIRAGYSEKLYSAEVQGCRLLSNIKVKARINELMDARQKRTEITSDVVLQEILLLAKTDLSRAYDDNGKLLPIKEIPEDIRRAIAGVKVFEEFEGFGKDRVKIGEVRELKLWDKPRALELLGKHLKLFTEKIEHSGSIKFDSISDDDLDKRINELLKKGENNG